MGTLEKDRYTGELFALKTMAKKRVLMDGSKSMVANERICLRLLDSPFTVRLRASREDERHIYFLIEPCLGGELFDLYTDNAHLFGSEVHAQFYAACVALGLDHMHSKRIVYRDLKLENCLISLTGYIKLADMGIAKVCVGKTYTVCGTPDYFAPE